MEKKIGFEYRDQGKAVYNKKKKKKQEANKVLISKQNTNILTRKILQKKILESEGVKRLS